jgi:hypothetical protein
MITVLTNDLRAGSGSAPQAGEDEGQRADQAG